MKAGGYLYSAAALSGRREVDSQLIVLIGGHKMRGRGAVTVLYLDPPASSTPLGPRTHLPLDEMSLNINNIMIKHTSIITATSPFG